MLVGLADFKLKNPQKIHTTTMKLNLNLRKNWYHVFFTFNKERYRFPLKTQVEAEANKLIAQAHADWLAGCFDWSFQRYRGDYVSPDSPKPEKPVTSGVLWKNLFEEFIIYKSERLESQSIGDYKQLSARLTKVGTFKSMDVFYKAILHGKSGRKMGTLLHAFGAWCVVHGKLSSNPFTNWKSYLIVEDSDTEPDPFNYVEQAMIEDWFGENQPGYFNFVKFLFRTGCRPGEAIEVRKRDFTDKHVKFSRTRMINGGVKYGLKTQKYRLVPINDAIRAIIATVTDSNALLFVSTEGNHVNWRNFRARYWKQCLHDCGIRYRRPYCIRHTTISRWVSAGISSDIVAKWVGNSPEIIHRHYLKVDDVELPEI